MPDNTQKYLEMMQVQESLQELVRKSKEIEQTKFEDVSRSVWQEVVAFQVGQREIFEMLIGMMPSVAKLTVDEAVTAHVQAVLSAED